MQRSLLVLLAPFLLAAYGTTPLRIEQGATWSKSLRANRDLTGCTLDMEIRGSPGGTLLGAPTITVDDAVHGQFTASFTALQTGQLAFSGEAAWDVEATCGATVLRLFEGTAILDLGVTTDEVAPGSFPAPGTPPGALYVTKAGADTITGQKTIAVTASGRYLKLDATVIDRDVLAVYRNNNTAGPEWATGTVINSQGAYYSNAWAVWSGHMQLTPDADGIYMPENPTSDPFMVGVYNDTEGPSFWSRANPTGGFGYHFQATDHNATPHFVFSIEEDGRLKWGAGTTHASEDASLYRTGAAALRTDSSLTVDGGVVSSSMASAVAQPLTLTSRMTNGSGSPAFTFTKENSGNDVLLKVVNGAVLALQLDGNTTLDANQGQAVSWAWKLGVIPGQETYPGLWFGAAAPTLSNYSFLLDPGGSGTAIVNAPSGGTISLRVGNAQTARITAAGLTPSTSIAAVPSAPVACASSIAGAIIYVDDSNDGAVSHLCFCGTAADDATYGWRRADAPATGCP